MKEFVGIYLKISPQLKEKLENLGIGNTEVFLAGAEKKLENYEEELTKIVEKRHKEYIRVYTKLKDFNKNNREILTKLDENCFQYLENRSIEDPSDLDINWIESKIEKHNLNISVDNFLNRCSILKGDVK